MNPKNYRSTFGVWDYGLYYVKVNQPTAQEVQDSTTDRLIEATLSGMAEFPAVKTILDKISYKK